MAIDNVIHGAGVDLHSLNKRKTEINNIPGSV